MHTNEKFKQIRGDLEKALADVAARHGIDCIKVGKISYDNDGFRTSLEATFQGGEPIEIKTLRLNAQLLGFQPDIAGSQINYGTKQFTVTGVKRTKLTLQDSDGKQFVAPIDKVLNVLRQQKSPLVLPELKIRKTIV